MTEQIILLFFIVAITKYLFQFTPFVIAEEKTTQIYYDEMPDSK